MANILAAIGSAAPALTSEWRSIQAEERQRRQDEQQAQLYPIQKEAAETNVAISKANLAKIQQETIIKKQAQEKLNAPANYRQMVKKMGLLPEMENQALAIAAAHGIDPESGVGTVDQTMKALDDLIKGDTWKSMSSGMAQYHSVRFEETSRKYQEAKEKGAPLEQLEKLRGEVQKAQGDASKWGGVVTKTTEMIRNREAIGNNIKAMKDSGDWEGLSKMDQLALSQAQESGSEALWKDAMGKILARKETVGKGTDFKIVQDPNSPTGYSYKSLVDPKQPMVQGAPNQGDKNQTEVQLTTRALKGDKEAQSILDAMQSRKLTIAQATMDVKSKDIDIQGIADSIAEGQDARIAVKGSMGNPVASKAQSLVLKKYPKFDFTMSDANYKWKQSAVNQRTINFAGGSLPRVSALVQQLNQMPNADIPAINRVMREVSVQTGKPEFTNFESNRNAIVQEINTALSGSATGSDMRIRIELENLQSSRSPAQIKGAISNLNEALIARMDVDLSPIYPIEVVQGKKTMDQYKKELFDTYRKPFLSKKEQTQSKGTKTYSQNDLEFTAKKHGISVEEVKRKLGVE